MKTLSKSQFIRGQQCTKSLWLYRNRQDLMTAISSSDQRKFDDGHEIGQLAWQRFPGGVEIKNGHLEREKALEATRKAVADGAKYIYEASVLFDRVFVMVDVLKRNPDGTWDLIEVKGSTSAKDVYLSDMAVQRYVLEGAGYRVRKTILMHVNNQYVRKGKLDPKSFFTLADMTAEVNDLMKDIPAEVRRLHKVLDLKSAPDIEIGAHCDSPYGCSFKDHCWKAIPDYSIYNIVRIRAEKIAVLRERGIIHVHKVPDDFPLSASQKLQVSCAKTKKPFIDPPAIAKFLGQLVYPLYFLDFETINPALPPYDGLRPYQQLTFQASIHIQERQGGPLRHAEFLADGLSDPRPGMAEFLVKEIGPKGTVVAYNIAFEKQRLMELSKDFPRHAKILTSAAQRLLDLGTPFRSGHYVHPDFQGSWSIKVVLPTLVSGMSYANLAIGDGGAAQTAFISLMKDSLTAKARQALCSGLLEYCGQDTMAMVKILDCLQKK